MNPTVRFAKALLDKIELLRCGCGACYDSSGIVLMSNGAVSGWRCSACEARRTN